MAPHGIFTVAACNNAIFNNSLQDDVLLTTSLASQKIAIGNNNNQQDAALLISTSGIYVSRNIVPAQDAAYDLGSSNMRYRDLYLTGNTLYLGGVAISKSQEGSVQILQQDLNPARLIVKEVHMANDASSCNVLVIKQDPNTGNASIEKAVVSFDTSGTVMTTIQASSDTVIKNLYAQSNFIAIGDTVPKHPFHVTNVLTVTSTRVGINTTNPQSLLDVNGQFNTSGITFGTATGTSGTIATLTADAVNTSGVTFGTATGNAVSTSGITYGTGTGASLTLSTPLQVASGGTGQSALTLSKLIVGQGTSAVLAPVNLHWDNTNNRLGIGRTAPTTALDVGGTITSISVNSSGITTGALTVMGAINTSGVTAGTATLSTPLPVSSGGTGQAALTTNKLIVGQGTNAVITPANLHWDSTNSAFGIGTSNPSGTLHVAGSIFFTGNLIQNGAPFAPSTLCNLTVDRVAVGGYDGSNLYSASNLYWDNANQRLGVGTTTPGFPLHVNGFANSSNNTPVSIFASHDVAAFSDARVKTDLKKIDDALDKLDELTGYTFERIPSVGKRMAGIIAQDLLKVLPEVVNEDASGYYCVSYGNISALLVNAIKELKQEVHTIKEDVNTLKAKWFPTQ